MESKKVKQNGEMALPPVVYEDEAVLAFDKPSGLLVVADHWDQAAANLMALVHERLSAECFNVHRLDRQTSGVVVCGKTAGAVAALAKQFERNEVEKEYLALVRHAPKEDAGEIAAPILADKARPGRMVIHRRGKESVTAFEVAERFGGGLALLRVRPKTGRTHQIRVHLASCLACPIIGDSLYGDGRGLYLSEIKEDFKRGQGPERPLLGRLALHAARVTLRHPASGERLTIAAELPQDFAVTLKYLRRHGI